jgi:hypothetical protein
VFQAIHVGDPDQKLLAYQYLQMLPRIAQGAANKLWIVPSELTSALGGLSGPGGLLRVHDAQEPTGRAAGGPKDTASGAAGPASEAP